jgi:hypothetical protein
MRTSMRRFTMLTKGFSKKPQNHVALCISTSWHYDERIYKACAGASHGAGLSNPVWPLEQIVGLLDRRLEKCGVDCMAWGSK